MFCKWYSKSCTLWKINVRPSFAVAHPFQRCSNIFPTTIHRCRNFYLQYFTKILDIWYLNFQIKIQVDKITIYTHVQINIKYRAFINKRAVKWHSAGLNFTFKKFLMSLVTVLYFEVRYFLGESFFVKLLFMTAASNLKYSTKYEHKTNCGFSICLTKIFLKIHWTKTIAYYY